MDRSTGNKSTEPTREDLVGVERLWAVELALKLGTELGINANFGPADCAKILGRIASMERDLARLRRLARDALGKVPSTYVVQYAGRKYLSALSTYRSALEEIAREPD